MAADFSQAAIYVGTYAKYNAGSLFGKWFDLSDFADKDEFLEACKELHKDEDDPEFMFQDRENIPEELVCESWISDMFFELRDKVEDMDTNEQEAFSMHTEYFEPPILLRICTICRSRICRLQVLHQRPW